jgi:hypothetical protein
MSKEQTALTIFFDKIRVRFDKDSEEYEQLVAKYVLAKADERQQIIDAASRACQLMCYNDETSAEQYYNNKYGQ